MKLKADFHVHTHYSVDSSLAPEGLIKEVRKAGLDVLGVVDHGTHRGSVDVKKLANGNPLVLIGQEVKTAEGEIIVFNVHKDLPEERPLRETCRAAKELGGFIVVPHPFDRLRYGIGSSMKNVLEYIDAIEGFNSRCILDTFNRQARKFAKEHGKPVVAGSDAHFANEVGRAFTLVDCERNEESVLEAVRAGRTEIVGHKTNIIKHIHSKIRRELKK